jgi:16S rRNA C967 or C1407 C5-methylase (RsmB/RsmF family)
VLVYSVCTLTRKETVEIDQWLAGVINPSEADPGGDPDERDPGRNSRFGGTAFTGGWEAIAPPGLPWEPLGRGALLLPQAAGTDGMYVLALRRR